MPQNGRYGKQRGREGQAAEKPQGVDAEKPQGVDD